MQNPRILSLGPYVLTLRWWGVLGTLLGLTLTLYLAQWQWHKGQMLSNRLAQADTAPRALETLSWTDDWQYASVKIESTWRSVHTILLQHQFHEGRPGIRAYSVLALDLKTPWVLVDRGFFPKDTLPPPLTITSPLLGQVYAAWKNPFISENTPLVATDPLYVVRLDLDSFSRLWHHPIAAGIVKLAKESPGVGTYLPLSDRLTPARHYAYTLQWLGLAAVLLIGSLFAGLTRKPTCKNAPRFGSG